MPRNFKVLQAKMTPERRARVEKRVQEALKAMATASTSEPLTPDLQAELDVLVAMRDSEIDTTDMPPITDWSNAIRRLTRIKRPTASASHPAQQSNQANSTEI